MKANVRTWSLLALLLAILAFIIFRYCRNGGEGGKDSGGSIVWVDPIKSPVAIAFIDADSFLDLQIPKLKVTLVDPGGKVVTSNGLSFTEMEITGGTMCLALKKDADFSTQSPYRFTIIAEANGYSSNIRNILVTSDAGQYVPIFMAKLKAPPAGMATFVGSTPLTAGLIGASGASLTALAPPVSNSISTDNIGVDIPAGAEPLYCGRSTPSTPFPQKLNFRVSYASPRNLATGRTFPGGSLVTDAVRMDGSPAATPSSPIYFASAGWINLEMDADGVPVNGFTKPVTVTMPIKDSLINPLVNPLRFYKAGDVIPVWSLNDRGIWREESIATVEAKNGKLYAKMNVTHLSTWNLDCTVNPCSSPAEDYTINYTNNSACTLYQYSELVRIAGGIAYGITGLGTNTDHILHYNSGSGSFTIARAPNGEQVKFVVYNNTSAPGTPPTTGTLAETLPFTINCATHPAQSCTIPLPAGQQCHTVKLLIDYQNAATPLCGNAIWYKRCGACDAHSATAAGGCRDQAIAAVNGFSFGGFLNSTDGTVSISKLDIPANRFSSVYCFRLWYTDTLLGERPIDFPIDLGDTSFSETSFDNITGYNGSGNVTIRRWYEPGTSTHRIRIMNGISTVPVCL